MTDFGHLSARGSLGGKALRLDQWGAGPFAIELDGRRWRFEDSDRLGPVLIGLRGDVLEDQPGERNVFWKAYCAWRNQGRRLADDGVTCLWRKPRASKIRRIGPRTAFVVDEGEDGGDLEIVGEEA